MTSGRASVAGRIRFQLMLVCLLAAAIPAVSRPSTTDPVLIGGTSTYVVRRGDSVASISARYGVAPETLIELNQLTKPGTLQIDQQLTIDNRHLAPIDYGVAITINIPQRMLFLLEGQRVVGYPVTVGRRSWPTPTGFFKILEKERDPVWDVPVSIQEEMRRAGKQVVTRVEPSPANPLGAHWLRLSMPSLGIHGTNAPSSIYQYASHGCIRMHPEDVQLMFDQVAVGASGVLIYEPILLAVVEGRIWLEANPDPYRRAPNAIAIVRDLAGQRGVTAAIDWALVDRALRERRGRAEDVTWDE